jgi:hypothetical protein
MNAEDSNDVDAGEEVQDASRDGFVSIWLAAETTEEEIDDYLAEVEDFDPEGENEEPFSDFANEFGLLWYDSEHSMEAAFERTPVPVEKLLGGASFSESFVIEATAAAAKEGFGPVQAAIMLYDVAYEPEHGAAAGERFRFLGAFPYKADDETEVE